MNGGIENLNDLEDYDKNFYDEIADLVGTN